LRWHRGQIFVANPRKPQPIVDILANPISKPKLLDFLVVRVAVVSPSPRVLCTRAAYRDHGGVPCRAFKLTRVRCLASSVVLYCQSAWSSVLSLFCSPCLIVVMVLAVGVFIRGAAVQARWCHLIVTALALLVLSSLCVVVSAADEQFTEEKVLLIQTVQALEPSGDALAAAEAEIRRRSTSSERPSAAAAAAAGAATAAPVAAPAATDDAAPACGAGDSGGSA
jgi:hypothetical protein